MSSDESNNIHVHGQNHRQMDEDGDSHSDDDRNGALYSDGRSDPESDEKSDDTYIDYSDEGDNVQSDERIECSDELGFALWNNRLNSIQSFVKEIQPNSLDLSARKVRRGEVVSVLKFLKDSHVEEIDLQNNNLSNGMKRFTTLLVQTKLKKLNLAWCNLTSDDVIQLMEVLKDSEITDLDLSYNRVRFYASSANAFVSHLLQSHITNLNMEMNYFMSEAGDAFTKRLPDTSITHLNLRSIMSKNNSRQLIKSLISNLYRTILIDLNLSENSLKFAELKQLSESLRDSKLQKLSLRCNTISDAGINTLMRGLINSKIIDLDVSNNEISGHNNLFHYLKYTQIKTLNLSENFIVHDEMFDFPEFLSGTSISTLKLDECHLRDITVHKLVKSLKFSVLTQLHLRDNHFGKSSVSEFSKIANLTSLTEIDLSNSLYGEEVANLSDCLKESKLKHINLSLENFNAGDADKNLNFFLEFMEKTKESAIFSLNLSSSHFRFINAVIDSLKTTKFTHLGLCYCSLKCSGAVSLGAALKFSGVTHLELMGNGLEDEGIATLAECLKETRVVKLDVSSNSITCKGVRALAEALKCTNLLHLILHNNGIRDDGFYCLAEKIRLTLITSVDVSYNIGSRKSLFAIDSALWENRKIVHRLISSFKRIAPDDNELHFRFDRNVESSDLNSLLEDCLFLYETTVERPSAANVLAQEESFSLSKNQLTILLLEEFPRQFAMFLTTRIEADITERVSLLKRVEELGLNKITELLILSRPVYMIDEEQGILHPYVYILMHKYKQPIVNSALEPDKKRLIIEYFTKHNEFEGASDIVSLLQQSSSDQINLSVVEASREITDQ